MKTLFKRFTTSFIRPLLSRYLSRKRTYRFDNIAIDVLPGVFHPGFFFSTKFLIEYLEGCDLNKKTLLELGAGSGLISFVTEKKGAIVTASDLSSKSIENLELNKSLLHSGIRVIRSDLFDDIPRQQFDFIVINPPYYPRDPQSEAQFAWYCGSNFEYFEKLFAQISLYIHPFSKVVLVSSEDCDNMRINAIAAKNNMRLSQEKRKKIWWEWNYIFSISQGKL